jgi:hypothetical protein
MCLKLLEDSLVSCKETNDICPTLLMLCEITPSANGKYVRKIVNLVRTIELRPNTCST